MCNKESNCKNNNDISNNEVNQCLEEQDNNVSNKFKSRKFILVIIMTIVFITYSIIFFILLLSRSESYLVSAIQDILYVITGVWALSVCVYFKINYDTKKLFSKFLDGGFNINDDK